MKWYRQHTRLTVIILVFLILLTLTMVSFANKGNGNWVEKQIKKIVLTVQEPISGAGNGAINGIKSLVALKSIKAENETLRQENAELKKENIGNRLLQSELIELRSLSEALNYEAPTDNYKHVTATVTAVDGSHWYRIFTINAGSKKGIHKNAIVINADGLIGRILDVGPDWAKVISVIDENSDISFQIFRDLNLLGILKGDGKGGLTGYMLDVEASIIEGDVLITSGMELYPQGIIIGKIREVNRENDALLQTIKVEPAVNFNNIQKVIVLIAQE